MLRLLLYFAPTTSSATATTSTGAAEWILERHEELRGQDSKEYQVHHQDDEHQVILDQDHIED